MNKQISFNPENNIVPECKALLKDLLLFSEQIEAHYRAMRDTPLGGTGLVFASIIQTTFSILLALFTQAKGEPFLEFRELLIEFKNKHLL